MKRYLSIFVVLLLLFSFSACNATGKSTTASSSAESSLSQSSGELPSDTGSDEIAEQSSEAVVSSGSISSQKPNSTASKAQGSASSQTASQATEPEKPKTVRVVIPEGFTLSQIGDRLEANGVCKKADLLKTANTYDFSYYSLIGVLSSSANRCYKLEGYLFPDTYDFYINMKPQDALGKMLRGAQNKIGSSYSYPGMTTDQVITLASIIEKESNNAAEMAKVSSVFHNRLKAGMRLQADVTINYVEKYLKPNLSDAHKNDYNSYYNTYKCKALPAGPICNPGANALYAASHPADTDYLYFAADSSGNYYYAKTLEEHQANLAKGGIIEGGGMQ